MAPSRSPFALRLWLLIGTTLLFSSLNLVNAFDADDPIDYDIAIAIELGTAYSRVGYMRRGKVKILANEEGNLVTPSYVAFTDEEILVGEAAKNQAAANPTRTIYNIERLIGRNFSDSSVQNDITHLPYNVVAKGNKPVIKVNIKGAEKTFTPEQLSAMVLRKMKGIAESYLDRGVTEAVVTIPAYFKDEQYEATKDACAIAGFRYFRVIREHVFAAVAYNVLEYADDHHVIVYHLDGSTLDVSLLLADSGVSETLATASDYCLEGWDFNQRIINHFAESYSKNNMNLSEDVDALNKLKIEVEKARHTLSSQMSTSIKINFKGKDFSEILTRAKFEELNDELFKRALGPVEQVLKDAMVEKTEIHNIILVGESTNIPKVHALVEEYFGGKKAYKAIHPDEAVFYGAAIHAGHLTREPNPNRECRPLRSPDLFPFTIGLETTGDEKHTQVAVHDEL